MGNAPKFLAGPSLSRRAVLPAGFGKKAAVLVISVSLANCASTSSPSLEKIREIADSLRVQYATNAVPLPQNIVGPEKLDSIVVDSATRKMRLYFPPMKVLGVLGPKHLQAFREYLNRDIKRMSGGTIEAKKWSVKVHNIPLEQKMDSRDALHESGIQLDLLLKNRAKERQKKVKGISLHLPRDRPG